MTTWGPTPRLPQTYDDWRLTIDQIKDIWEPLRPFFASHGYDLFHQVVNDLIHVYPRGHASPSGDGFGLLGDRSTYKSRFCHMVSCCRPA